VRRLVQSHADHLFLKPGEVIVTKKPMLVTTVLGSCIAVTLFSPSRRVGAICHAMLPWQRGDGEDLRYVDTAIMRIYRRMCELGGERDLVVKLFGGASILEGGEGENRQSIGRQNIASAEEVLARLRLSIISRDTGGGQGRKLLFCTRTGDVYLRRIGNRS